VLLLVAGLAVSQLAARARQLRVVAITDAGYLPQIHQASSMAKSPVAAETVVDIVKACPGPRSSYGRSPTASTTAGS
jgi:hypothetical protein